MLLVRICLGPVTVVLPAAEVLDFEFVRDFDIGMSDFRGMVVAEGRVWVCAARGKWAS